MTRSGFISGKIKGYKDAFRGKSARRRRKQK